MVENTGNFFSIPLSHTMKSYDIFPKFHVCKHILSTYCKWFLVESIFNIFIFKLNEFKWTFIFALILLYWYSVKPSLLTYLFRQRLCSRLTALWRYINFVLLLLLLLLLLQRHFTFDMLLHIGHWSLWLVTVMMYGRFHPWLLNVIRH